jgi:phosphate starvation-inducible membrane PsiE
MEFVVLKYVVYFLRKETIFKSHLLYKTNDPWKVSTFLKSVTLDIYYWLGAILPLYFEGSFEL